MLAETASFEFEPLEYHPSKFRTSTRLTWWILSRKLTKFPRLAFMYSLPPMVLGADSTAPVPVVGMSMERLRPYEVTLSLMRSWRASAFATVTAIPDLGQAPVILVIVYHNAFPSLVFISVDRFSNISINEKIDATALGTVRTAVTAAAAMFAAFVDAVVIAVTMAAVMDAMNCCMRPANAAAESSTTRFASTSESSVPGLIAAGSAAGSCLLHPLIFSLSLWRSRAMLGLINCSYTDRCRRSLAKR